jgi:hypothetical protein
MIMESTIPNAKSRIGGIGVRLVWESFGPASDPKSICNFM